MCLRHHPSALHTSPLCSPHASTAGSAVENMGMFYGEAPSRRSRNFHSLLQRHYWYLLESNGRLLEQSRPNLRQFRTSWGIPVKNSTFWSWGKYGLNIQIFPDLCPGWEITLSISQTLKGHPPVGTFIWIHKMKSLIFFPFILSTKALYHPENR